MRILAWRGQVVEGFGGRSKTLMGTIADRAALGNVVKMNDWNQYVVIARGGTFVHIINGQLMAVMIDDDPGSSNNQPGHVRDRDRGDDQGFGTEHLGQEDRLSAEDPLSKWDLRLGGLLQKTSFTDRRGPASRFHCAIRSSAEADA